MRLTDGQGRCKLDQPIPWTPVLVHRLEALEDNIAWVVDHWFDLVIGGFITEFKIDTTVSYNEVEKRFLKGLHGKYIKSFNTYIKMLLCESIDVWGDAEWKRLPRDRRIREQSLDFSFTRK